MVPLFSSKSQGKTLEIPSGNPNFLRDSSVEAPYLLQSAFSYAVLWVFSGRFPQHPELSPEHFRGISRKLPGRVRTFPDIFRNFPYTTSEISRKRPGYFPRCFRQTFPATFPEVSRDISWTFLRHFRGTYPGHSLTCSGDLSEKFRNFIGRFPYAQILIVVEFF